MSTQSSIVAAIEQAVGTGSLEPGAPLPSVRAAAREHGVSPGTAAAAYAELKRRGVVVAKPRSGMRVAQRSVAAPAHVPVPAGLRDLATGNPDPKLLPALKPFKLEQRLYGLESVDPGLRAVATATLRAEGIDPAHLCVVNGALDGIERALAAHLAPGDAVAVEDPGYGAIFDVVRALGLRPVTEIAGAQAVIVTPRGQNPTGAVLDPALRIPPDVLLIEDDHLGPAAGVPARTLSAGHPRWVHVRSVSKWLGPDLRVAVLAGDAVSVRRIEGRQAIGPGWVSTILQRAVAALWADEDAAALAEQAATVYAGRRNALLETLATHGIAATGESGLNVWIPVSDEGAVVAGLLARGWAVAPGARFRLESPPAIRVTTATLRPADARRLAADLAALLAPSAATRAA